MEKTTERRLTSSIDYLYNLNIKILALNNITSSNLYQQVGRKNQEILMILKKRLERVVVDL